MRHRQRGSSAVVSVARGGHDDQVAVEIVSRSGTAFLVSADEYHALRETVHLLQSPRNAARLRESLEDVRADRLLEKDLPAE